MEESRLIEQLREESEQAFETIYELYVRQLLAYTYSYVKSKEDSEEIVQDVFITLWQNRKNIRNDKTLRPFLLKVATRRIIDVLRLRISNVVYEDYMSYACHYMSNNEPVDYDHYLTIVKEKIKQLPPVQRRILTMSLIDGKDNREIARTLSINEKTVRNQLSLGNKALRAAIEKVLTIFYIIISVTFFTFFRHL